MTVEYSRQIVNIPKSRTVDTVYKCAVASPMFLCMLRRNRCRVSIRHLNQNSFTKGIVKKNRLSIREIVNGERRTVNGVQ